ncbi:MAG: hypothetical protein K6G73_06235 [Marinilabiliaceae bacterium]|nr:hypothetical protein [Marinilabiliaceae bacterium]
MKHFQYAILSCAALASMFSACSDVDDAISDLDGIYAAPTDLEITSATISDKTKEGTLRTYTIDFATKQGTTVTLALVSSQYFLPTNGYTYAAAGTAKNGNFTDGSTIGNSVITSGTLALTQDGDNYTISRCSLFGSDGAAYRLQGSAVLEFLPDDPTALTVLKGVTNNGDGTITVVASTGGYVEGFDMTTYQPTYTGEGNDIQIVFNTAELKAGTYAPGSGYVVGETFMNNAYEAFGVPAFEDYRGSLWYTIADGKKTPTLITKGDIVVTENNGVFSILLDQGKGGIYAEFVGRMQQVELSVVKSVQTNEDGTLTMVLSTGTYTEGFDMTTYQSTFDGDGFDIQIIFNTTDLQAGTYAANSGYKVGYTFMNNAYEAYGVPAFEDVAGTLWYTIADGKKTPTLVTSGDIIVAVEGDIYTITITNALCNAKYVGKLFTE